ncbi:MAG: FtsL-like putative cell division protein [Bacteroidales bacterium]
MRNINQHKNIVEFEDVEALRKNTANSRLGLSTGNRMWHSLRENVWLLAYLTALMFIYISSNYLMDKMTRYKLTLKSKVKDCKIEATTSSAELMRLSSRNAVKQEILVRGLRLHDAIEPPVVLKKIEN